MTHASRWYFCAGQVAFFVLACNLPFHTKDSISYYPNYSLVSLQILMVLFVVTRRATHAPALETAIQLLLRLGSGWDAVFEVTRLV